MLPSHRMGKNVCTVISAVGMTGLTAIPLFVSPDHLTWTRWKVALVVTLIVGLVGLILQLYFQDREEKRRRDEQEKRDKGLVRKVMEEMQAAQKPKGPGIALDSLPISREMTLDDPRIYLSIKPAGEAMFPRTPFICSNGGKETAHKVQIQSLKLSGKTVTFAEVPVIQAGNRAETLPTINGVGMIAQHDIFHWLMKDWNDNGELVENWPVSITIQYTDALEKRRFEGTATLMFYPIRFMMSKSSNERNPPDFIKRYREPSWEFMDYKFRLLQ